MSIDREFRFLSKSWNSLNSWISTKNSVNKWKTNPSKMADFIKNSTLKYLVPALMITAWWMGINKHNSADNIHDESSLSMNSAEDVNSDINQIQMNAKDLLFDVTKNNLVDNSQIMYDKGFDEHYGENFVSSISIDENFNYAPWTHMSQDSKELWYLAMFQRLSMDDYQDMFKWLKNLRQWAFGNCYLVVAIKNIARSKYFDTLMMTSIKKNYDNSFNLYMPLWEPSWLKINISNEDLKSATIRWSIWYKILEVWFAKYLLFKKGIITSTDITMTNEIMKKMASWSTWETMMSLLWPKNYLNKIIVNNPANRNKIMNYMKIFDPKNLWAISVTSKYKEWKSDTDSYVIGWETIYYSHAYSLCAVEKEWDTIKSVILENPWNDSNKPWGHKIRLSIDDFFDSFFLINVGHANNSFLNLYTTKDDIKIIDSRNRGHSPIIYSKQ